MKFIIILIVICLSSSSWAYKKMYCIKKPKPESEFTITSYAKKINVIENNILLPKDSIAYLEIIKEKWLTGIPGVFIFNKS